jgi:hypothetical protein
MTQGQPLKTANAAPTVGPAGRAARPAPARPAPAPRVPRASGEPTPGSVNYRALVKVALVVAFVAVPWAAGHPAPVAAFLGQYVEDVAWYGWNETEGNWTWQNMSSGAHAFYYLVPVAFSVAGLAWYATAFSFRRKRLSVNGVPEGRVMWVYGLHRSGHLYDLGCALAGFRHLDWGDFPLPMAGAWGRGRVVVYYRAEWLVNPAHWRRYWTRPEYVRTGVYDVWLAGPVARRVAHPHNPRLDATVLGDEGYGSEAVDKEAFVRAHRSTQDVILRDNYRMTVSEPGVAKLLVRSSMMSVADETKSAYFNQLSPEAQAEFARLAQEAHGRGG